MLDSKNKMNTSRKRLTPIEIATMFQSANYCSQITSLKAWASLIRCLDCNTCQMCGCYIDNTYKHFGVVHHLDFNREHNDPSNLFLVCISCHAILHGNGHPIKRTAQEAIELFQQTHKHYIYSITS